MKVLTGSLPLLNGNVRLGETARIGYYEQTGLILTPEQETQPVLRFVQEAVDRATMTVNTNAGDTLKSKSAGIPKMQVEEGGNLGRRKMLAGKESTVTVQLQDPSTVGGTVLFPLLEVNSLRENLPSLCFSRGK